MVFPTSHPAVLHAVSILGPRPKSAPALDTDLVLALDAGANDKESPEWAPVILRPFHHVGVHVITVWGH